MKTKILVLIWFGFQVVLADRDLLQQPGITPQITSSSHYSNWSADKILSNYSQSNSVLCQCCASIITPGYIDIDLRQIYSVSRVVVLGRRDQTDGSQFDNVILTIHNGESITWSSKTNTVLSVDMYPYDLTQNIRLSSTHQSGGVMTICNVKVYGPEYLTGFPTQSSVYNTNCTADKALNGIEDPGTNDAQLCQACSVTTGLNPWWSLDLGGEHLIGSIQVVGRDTNLQSSGLQVTIANALVDSSVVIPGNIDTLGLNQQITPPRLARYINITTVSRAQQYMVLCEVKIFETDCPNGTYGDKCAGNCRHCKGGFSQCDHVYGTCKLGCETGYEGSLCLRICTNKTFGHNCEGHCRCKNTSEQCNVATGHCSSGCANGLEGVNCSKDCENGWFGETCNMTCGFCKNGAVCDKVSGNCTSGCDKGHMGQRCKSGCDKQAFGYNCENECHCYECDDEDGSCGLYSCYRGWGGETCSQPIHTDEKQFESQKTGGGNIAIAVLTTLLVVSIIGNTIAIIMHCRRKARKSLDENDYAVPGESVPSDYITLGVSEMNSIPTERHNHNMNDGQ